MTPDEFDDLLDAFAEAAPRDDADAAAERLLAGQPSGARRSWTALVAASALAAAAGVALTLAPGPAAPVVAPTPPPTVAAVVVPSPTATPVPATPTPPPVVTPTPQPTPPPPPPAVREALARPGLASVNRTVGHVVDGTAHLLEGVLRYRHDAAVDPRVDAVRLDALDVVFTPVGTAFTVGAEPGLGAIVVTDGTVLVDHAGDRIARLQPGDGLLIAEVDGAVQHRQLKGPVDAVVAGLGLADGDAEDARNLVVRLRLAGRDTSALERGR
jgi:hypothetical protein